MMDWASLELSLYSRTNSPEGHCQHGLISSSDDHCPEDQLQWINRLSQLAHSGIVQAAILAISATWFAFALHTPIKPVISYGTGAKASKVQWSYEVCAQVLRVLSVALMIAAHVRGQSHILDPIVLAYGFILGIFRLLTKNLFWRHAALHQTNFVYTATFVALLVGQFLPCIQVRSECGQDPVVVSAVVARLATFVLAVTTPREWIPPSSRHDIPGCPPINEPAPEETCSWLNYYCAYSWLDSVIWKGTKKVLDMSGIPNIPWYDEPLYLLRKVQKARSLSTRTLWTVLRYQRKELSLMSAWIAGAFVLENIAPYSMFKLLDYLARPEDATYQPWVWLVLVFVGPMSRSVFYQQYIFNSTRLIVRVRSGFTQELYHKALDSMELEDDPFERSKDSSQSGGKARTTQKTTSAGRLATLMAADVDAIYRARDMIMACVGVPSGMIVSVIGMYRMLGWPAIVGVAILIIGTPITLWFGRLLYGSQSEARKAQDTRISLVTEYLASIRAIKYFAWEGTVTDRIIEARKREQKQLWRVSMLQAMINQVSQILPSIALLAMFGLHVGVARKRLDASVAFTTLYLVRTIRRNILQASQIARSCAAALVSLGRLDKYFASARPLAEHLEGPLAIHEGTFRRNEKAAFALSEITINFVEGGLNVINGPSGSGKTTLLLAILGEACKTGGTVTRPRDVAFASQSPWLQNETIKDNVLFGSSLDQARYDRVVEACCLDTDLDDLQDGDLTVVGENGTSLSGGQKARVALARALYSNSSLLLLDDIFSALDARTAAALWKHCFCSNMLKNRTVVLVTQVPWIPLQGDLAITLDNGRIQNSEQNLGVTRHPITVAEALRGETEATTDTQNDIRTQQNGNGTNGKPKNAENKASKDLVEQETKASGKIGRLTFLQYMTYFGHPAFAAACLIALLISGLLSFFSTYWLSVWVEAYNHKAHIDIAFYMGMFALLTFVEIASYAAIIIMFEWGAWRAARRLHNDFVRAVMRVSLSWFKDIPIGRITNRFAGDMASIDGQLSGLIRFSLEAITQLFFRIAAVSTIMPVFMVPAVFTCFFGIVLAEMYTRTAVVTKRLMSSAQSPVFSQFADTLAGLAVIRARAGMAQKFREELAAKLRVASAASEAAYNCNRWVAVRIDLVTALVALCAGIIAVSKAGLVGAGLVGFSLTNANQLSQTILALVRAMNDLEVEMQSFHRVKEYVKVEAEEKHDKTYQQEGEFADDESEILPLSWPQNGELEFKNVTIRYDEDGPNILTDVNLKFKAGERVAIVGRTGSGKSTLVLSLLRFTHIVKGQILYNGFDITKIPRHRLRESLTIIPQEAVLFNGSVESNLDPTGLVPQSKLEHCLSKCKSIASFENSAEDGHHRGIQLSSEVDARGENFSHGQRQVLSLCRALVRGSKLMLLDEATASMDYETDRGIQKVLREELQESGSDEYSSEGGRTLVTIAHRLRTIIDYDKVVVMSSGRVVECDSPQQLYRSKGQFYDMVCHSGEMEQLQELLG